MPTQLSPGVNVSEIDLTTIVPAVATSTGAIAGIFNWGPIGQRVLVDTESTLVNNFGRPTSNNPETFFTASNFLGYTNALWVVRTANTTSANTLQAAKNAYVTAPTTASFTGAITTTTLTVSSGSVVGTIAIGQTLSGVGITPGTTIVSGAGLSWVVSISQTVSSGTIMTTSGLSTVATAPVILNTGDFNSKYTSAATNTFDANVLFVAKWAGGTYGNSLRISICDSVNAYSSNVNFYANTDTSATLTSSIGSNQISVSVNSISTNGTTTSTFATNLFNSFAVGDLLVLGNSSIGTQYLSISNISNPTLNATSNVCSFTISTYNTYNLSTQYIANTTVNNSNSTYVPVSRRWEFAGVVGTAPITSSYQAQFGNSSVVDTMHVVVQDQGGVFTGVPGSILETWTNVSRATDNRAVDGSINYYQTVINYDSSYIWSIHDRFGAISNTTNNIVNSTNYAPLSVLFAAGNDGAPEYDSNNSILATVTSGYQLFQSPEDVDISLVLQGKPITGSSIVTNGPGAGLTVNNFQLANWLIDNLCAVRKDCVAFITPSDDAVTGNAGNIATGVVAWRTALHDSSYAVIDSGYKYQYDRYNDVNRYVPTNGDIAGLCARTDNLRDPWWSPAGYNRGQIKNVIQMRWNPRLSQRDLLYSWNINPVVSLPGSGTILYGDKTLQSKPSAFDRINVRRLFIVLEKAISLSAKYSLFEFNDAFTQAQFKNMVTPYLRQIQGRRGITDFLVVCDGTNNTPTVVDANQFVGDIYIKPARSINFIQLNFVAVGTGVTFSAIVGKF
jgi:phage tail sheath protein FI